MSQIVLNGNNIDLLKQYPDNYFDAVVTDPPYGLGKEPNAEEVMKGWIEKGYHEVGGSGFMGKEWDAFIPQPIFWKEVFRVLKHGGHVVSFFGTRTYDWGVMSMRFAGFEIRDCIQWLYGSGFPKSLSVSKSIDKQNKNKWSNICKSIDIINQISILDTWKEKSRYVKSADVILEKNLIEIGTNIQKKDFAQESVILKVNQKNENVIAIIAELNLKEVQHYVEENQSTAQKSVGVSIEQSQSHVKYVEQSLKDPNLSFWNIFFVQENVKEFQNEKTNLNHKVEEVLRICHGNQKSLKEEDILALCVEAIKDLKHTILSQSKTFQNLDMKLQMECASAINVIIMEYMAVNLISNMVNILKSKAIDKLHGAEREVIGEKIRGDVQKAKENGSGYLSDPANRNNEKQFGYGVELITKASTDAAKQWEGWGSSLKPANEPIVLARKPLEKGLSIAENVLKWGVGGINIDASRIGTQDKIASVEGGIKRRNKINQEMGFRKYENGFENQCKEAWEQNAQGRFPANLILTHHPECECKGLKKVKGSSCSPDDVGKGRDGDYSNGIYGEKSSKITVSHTDLDGMEVIEDWTCHEDCPIKIMDEQSGISKSTGGRIGNKNGAYSGIGAIGFTTEYKKGDAGIGDTGGASRFFYCAKASKSERNKGLEGFTNGHPTIKPVKLMQYLARLITPPNGKVIDPFCGSGTTGIACKLEGFEFVGMEQDAEYTKIAQARIENYQEEPEQPLELIQEDSNGNTITQTSLF